MMFTCREERTRRVASLVRLLTLVSCLLGMGLYRASALWAEEETSSEVFNRICANCHNNNPPPRAMRGEQLRALPPEKIFFALDKGMM
jgi:hypothetical protein